MYIHSLQIQKVKTSKLTTNEMNHVFFLQPLLAKNFPQFCLSFFVTRKVTGKNLGEIYVNCIHGKLLKSKKRGKGNKNSIHCQLPNKSRWCIYIYIHITILYAYLRKKKHVKQNWQNKIKLKRFFLIPKTYRENNDFFRVGTFDGSEIPSNHLGRKIPSE